MSEVDRTFHAGERALQARAGSRPRLAEVGPRVIRDYMPDQHRLFFAELPMLFVGSLDAQGRPWASVLTGRPGFVTSPEPRTLVIRAKPAAVDPLAQTLTLGMPIGLLGIQLETRRRNRMNGTVTELYPDRFTATVGQSFGNCPQYIQSRVTWLDAEALEADGPAARDEERIRARDKVGGHVGEARAFI
ncbi:MAG TPA: pyridoxamine 5'-phosphate oxidase family protein, partial [Alphaproteobacteria bacterium]|nr:pyridoxamine 5'-phosphate oxidase family protein [Alphaproteobacteria bacterium]